MNVKAQINYLCLTNVLYKLIFLHLDNFIHKLQYCGGGVLY